MISYIYFTEDGVVGMGNLPEDQYQSFHLAKPVIEELIERDFIEQGLEKDKQHVTLLSDKVNFLEESEKYEDIGEYLNILMSNIIGSDIELEGEQV